tara:strand:+ start:1639 stop:2670 length:1032 start_codon:yes stop_codon:yes gene_type:complete
MSIIIVGDYLTQRDDEEGGPFLGGLGKTYKAWMRQIGIDPRQCEFINVIDEPPIGRQSIFGFCGPKEQSIPGLKYVKRGSYLLREYFPKVERLWKIINTKKPNLVIAAGELALWALTSETSLLSARGRIHSGHSGIPGIKVLPTFGPQHIMGNWPDRMILLSDLEKARREAEFPEVRRPQRFIHLYPSLEDMEDFLNRYILPEEFPNLDVDIETKGQMITCVGFAPSRERAIVIPFYDVMKPDGNYWPTKREEYLAWCWVRRVLKLGKKVGGQNYQYDMQYLWRQMGIKSPDFADDTMLLHHALYPELRKGLGFMASLYTDELPWKFMHKIKVADKTGKKEDE